MQRIWFGCFAALLLVLPFLYQTSAAPPQSTRPTEGIRENTPNVHALVGGTIVVSPDKTIDGGTLVIRDGVIVDVGKDVSPPADARIWDMKGKTLYAGFINAYVGVEADAKAIDAVTSGAADWNENVLPQLQAESIYKKDNASNKKLRSQGITLQLVAPTNGILNGRSSLISTADEDLPATLAATDVAMHLKLTVPRSRDRKKYPNSPMGAVALMRQTFYDADWYGQASEVVANNARILAPEKNDALAVIADHKSAHKLFLIDTPDELYVLRAGRFAEEFQLQTGVVGSGHEYKRLDAIAALGVPVILPLNFPQPPDVSTVEQSLSVSLERLMHWDLAPDNPKQLTAAGVQVALTTKDLKDVGDFLKQIRVAVKRGWKSSDALRALTTSPAELCGVSGRYGTLEAGKTANIVIADGDLFADKTKVTSTWISGKHYAVGKDDDQDSTPKNWDLTVQGKGSDKLTGTLSIGSGKKDLSKLTLSTAADPKAKEPAKPVELEIEELDLFSGQLHFQFKGEIAGRKGVHQFGGTISAAKDEKSSASLHGRILWSDGEVATVSGDASVESEDSPSDKETASKEDSDDDKKEEGKEVKATSARSATAEVNFPLGGFGVLQSPEQPDFVLFKDATVWTAGPEGTLETGSVLVRGGKIIAIGREVQVPKEAKVTVVDCRGKHVSPGIIDCHSHIATDGGVNESGQAVTAEVRIGDFIDPDDINIYRQLAGGVTSSHILHGSANPIGGQCQLIKFRWGSLPEAMKVEGATPTIKFALGENVKQSNWGDDYRTRYPQSRMGVEQIIRDRFEMARQYEADRKAYQQDPTGLPPRRDLELDALLEVLNAKRYIHCHAYRQDEMLGLIATCKEYGVTIGAFQHVLEGYKIADAMVENGVMGSAFADWWAYKFEVYDAIPYNGPIMHKQGVVVSYNSDDAELARRLNLEAAKASKYGGISAEEALKFVTLNPAKQLRIDHQLGSLEPGKDADIVIWNRPPLSSFSRVEQTWIDGRKYFDRALDAQMQQRDKELRAKLVQKILSSGEEMIEDADEPIEERELWPRHDAFCLHGVHDHDHGHDQQGGHNHE